MAKNEDKMEKALKNIGIALGKKFTPFITNNTQKIRTSVDFTLKDDENEKQLLIEVDSYNMAKVVVGQYVLLNQISKICENKNLRNCEECIKQKQFIVVHFYKNYNSERTIKHLNFIYKTLFQSRGIPFSVFTEDEFIKLCKKLQNKENLINHFFDNQ